MITQARLKELLDYNPETGVFTRRVSLSNRVKVGDVAGSKNSLGYLTICIDGKNQFAHRLAWLYVHGEMPRYIDHINHDPSDNRIENLRSVSPQGNSRNQKLKSTNTSGFCGVYWNKRKNKWHSQIVLAGRNTSLGYYTSIEEAVNARKSAEIKHGFHENHGCSAR